MKIIFGNTLPPTFSPKVTILDAFFYNYLRNANENFERAVEAVVEVFGDTDTNLWTCNPLIPNYLTDEDAKKLVYIYIDGDLVNMGDDEHLCKKLSFMGPGDALADDGRIWGELK